MPFARGRDQQRSQFRGFELQRGTCERVRVGGGFTLVTPGGLLSPGSLSTSISGLPIVRRSFPPQNLVGDYWIEAGPDIENIFGRPMSQVYTGAFTVVLPTIAGTVTDTNGSPVEGVLLQPSGGLVGIATDANGNYVLGVPSGWNGGVTPALDALMFAPRVRAYTNVTSSASGENYLAVPTIAPAIASGLQGTNLLMNWHGLPGVAYQFYYSTNLTDWVPSGDLIIGSNSVVELLVPADGDPLKFFRVRAKN
jgi:hypothetical protein